MNHIRRPQNRSLCTALCPRHPERSLTAASQASREPEFKGPMPAESAIGESESFRMVRFFDEHTAECIPLPNREAAAEFRPRRKPWKTSAAWPKVTTAGQSRQ